MLVPGCCTPLEAGLLILSLHNLCSALSSLVAFMEWSFPFSNPQPCQTEVPWLGIVELQDAII